MEKVNISCVIVTFNRKELLCQCIDAVLHQTYKPTTIYVVNNASTDGTEELLQKKGYIASSKESLTVDDCEIRYLPLTLNIGGAGGFCTGMKIAYEEGASGIWVMDDDGIPDSNCLASLVKYLGEYDYIAPMVLNINDSSKMAFEYCGTRDDFEDKAINGLVHDVACPFNGILYSRSLIETIGLPKKEMFIWGDEENYNMRAVEGGFKPVTVIQAVHKHPANRVMVGRSLFGQIDIAPQMWRCYCRYRNMMYNHKSTMSFWGKSYVFINHVWYYLVKRRSIKWTMCFVNAFRDGLREDFTKLNKYM